MQTLYALRRLLRPPAVRTQVLQRTQILAYLFDLSLDQSPQVKRMASSCLDELYQAAEDEGDSAARIHNPTVRSPQR